MPPIPQPRRLPVLGHLREIDRETPVQSFIRLARRLGPIYRLELPGRSLVVLSGRELVDEVCDQRRFDKLVSRPLRTVRAFAGDGLFTAWSHEPNWKKAHDILLPNFSATAIRGYLPQMIEIAEQLIGKWSRLNARHVVDVADDMTRLTLDTIGLCGFDYRFNSFFREEPHPFVAAMVRTMHESLLRVNRLAAHEALLFRAHRRYARDVEYMNAMVDRLVRERRADPQALASRHDLLNHMLTGIDRHSGEALDDLNIRYQIITFLIAGHETTSGLLSFAFHFLLKNPQMLARAMEEVDRVLDPEAAPTIEQVRRLAFLQQVLKESLRLWPTAPGFSLYPREDTVIGGRYAIGRDENVLVLIPMLHRDPAVWGDNPEEFDPDRFAPELERALPANSFKPFGNGQRACIGQQFAMQEATLVLAMLLRRFEPVDHGNYRLTVKETLTLKPDGFTMQVRPRARRAAVQVALPAARTAQPDNASTTAPAAAGTPLHVLFGSNLGTAEHLAGRIAADAGSRGFAVTLASLDEYAGRLPTEGTLVIVSSSYNGGPPDNAARFHEWLRTQTHDAGSLRGVRYAVFGCGDRNWAATYQQVPAFIDEQLAARGATRLCGRGAGDMADDFDGQFHGWYGGFWRETAHSLGLEATASAARRPTIRIEPVAARIGPAASAHGAVPMTVVANRELQSGPDGRSTRHIELALPEGVTYQAGDHLGVIARNRPPVVRRVLERFRLHGDSRVVLCRGDGASHLPFDVPVSLWDLLSDHVELQEPATREQIAALASRTACPPEKARLLSLLDAQDGSAGRYREDVLAKRVSLPDLLEQCPASELPFDEFLGLLPPPRPRYYSISSSPLAGRMASITVGVVSSPARSGRGRYEGVASNYLAERPAGSLVQAFVRSPGTAFRPPADPAVPMIMVGAGTGLAPFRGFLQERAALKQSGAEVGPSLLFFGCRHPAQDFLYESELRDFESRGLVKTIAAFSRLEGQPKCYVQQAIVANAGEVGKLVEGGAVIYVCGDAARMAMEVRVAFRDLGRDRAGNADAAAWLEGLRSTQRYVEDVWAAG